MLNESEISRYARHFALPDFGEEGQLRLKRSSVLVVGAGGLGAPLIQYLAAAGVGRMGIIDGDAVELSNLQRQVLFSESDIGRNKAEVAAERVKALNPHVQTEVFPFRLTRDNALDIVDRYDVVADGADNFPTRYLVCDATLLCGKVNVHASIFRYDGQVSVFNLPLPGGGRGPNYRDLFPEPPAPGEVPSCADGGVLGVLPGILGSLQAAETLKVLAGVGEPLSGRLFTLDVRSMESRILRFSADPENPLTGKHPTQFGLVDYEAFCGLAAPSLSPAGLAGWRAEGRPHFLLDVREPAEHAEAEMGGMLIPLGELEDRLGELPGDLPIVIHCRSGARSLRALTLLEKHGFSPLFNLEGGILGWEAYQSR